MNSHSGGWVFGPSFNFGTAPDVFVQVNQNYKPPINPSEGYFLYLNGGIFTLLNGQSLDLL